MKFYLHECPDDTVILWTASGRPVWTFTSIPEAIAGGLEWAGEDPAMSAGANRGAEPLDTAA